MKDANPIPQSGHSNSHRYFQGENLTLGLNLMGHDISYSLLSADGTPLIIAEEERYSRRKKGTFVPSPRQVFEILDEVGASPESVRRIAIANIPELLENRASDTRSQFNMPVRYGQSKCFDALFRSLTTKFTELEAVVSVRHHLCHAASAFLPSPYESAAVVTVDGMGEDETATIWQGAGNCLTKLFSVRHPDSIGYLYQAFSQWAGMTGAEREGKLMGLASFGEPVFLERLREKFLSPDATLGFFLSPGLRSLPCDNKSWVEYCESHFGARRAPDSVVTQHHMNVAASIQALLEECLLNLLKIARRLTNARYCCLAGGVFMNSMANGKLRRAGLFEDLWVQPLAGDNGLSLGAALWAHVQNPPAPQRWRMTTPFWGSDLKESEIFELTELYRAEPRRSSNVEAETARFLADGKLVGWFQGRSEVGYRALGHRSILADPRSLDSKDKINSQIKHREPWRPFATAVLEEDAGQFVEDCRPSPFMMFVTPITENAPIPAGMHFDNTTRIQTVSRNFDARFHRLLYEFKLLTGVGALVNTSFNLNGEPIVRTPEEAYRDFAESGMDVLVIGDYIFEKTSAAKAEYSSGFNPRPRIRLPSVAGWCEEPNHRLAIVSLGLPEHLETIEKALPGRFETFLPPSRSGFPLSELLGPGQIPVDISTLALYDSVVVLLPTWVEVAEELIPNLLSPFLELAAKSEARRIIFVDEFGGEKLADEFDCVRKAIGSVEPASEIEHFWLKK